MGKIGLCILAVLVLGLFLFGCVAQPGAGANVTVGVVEQIKYVCADGTTIVTNITSCPTVTVTTTARTLSTEEELSVCAGMPEMQGASLEDLCITGVAAKNKNTSVCLEASRDSRAGCYASVAIAKDDVNTCAEAAITFKDSCYESYATNARDVTGCAKISEVNRKDNCYNNLVNTLGDATICEKISGTSQKDSCYWSIASRTRDTTYCDKIISSDQKQNCLQNIGSGSYSVPTSKYG
jgi:hypothetical protein